MKIRALPAALALALSPHAVFADGSASQFNSSQDGTAAKAATVAPTGGAKTRHSEYSKYADKWQRCRDVMAGQDAVHAAGIRYLPMLKDMDMTAYRAYVQRATFFNASARTLDGLSGMLFRLPPRVNVPPKCDVLMSDVTTLGDSLEGFTLKVTREALAIGRCGILVDYPMVDTTRMTQADAAGMNLRPRLCLYAAEAITNWSSRSVNNKITLSMVVLREEATENVDEFTSRPIEQYRVLDLDATRGNIYRVRIFRKAAEQDEFVQMGADTFPTMNGENLAEIPFKFIGPFATSWEVTEPPLLDLVDMNLSHYRLTATYEHALFFLGSPTAYIAGYQPPSEGTKLYIGASSAWVFPDPTTRVGFLELTGDLTPLANGLEKKEKQMAVLGARMLQEQKRAVETAEVAAIHRQGEQSLLATLARSISSGIEQALKWFCEWAGANVTADDSVTFDLNRDFYPAQMSPQQLTALVMAWLQGAISKETLFQQLQEGEVIPQDKKFEDEETAIRNEAPPAPTGVPPAEGAPPGAPPDLSAQPQ